jgi:protein involved in polysaccharide export with SLBB domain
MDHIKLRHIISFFLLLLLVVISHPVTAQITQEQVSDMLAKSGIPEDTLRERLIKKGFNPDQIRPDQIDQFQAVIIETIHEIEEDQLKSQEEEKKPEPKQPPVQKPEVKPEPKPEAPPEIIKQPPLKAPIYGQEIFRNNSIAVYQKSDDITPPDDYVLGVGDQVGVIGFGRSQFDDILTIGADGFVQPNNRLPKILLLGLKFGDAKEVLFQRYRQYHLIERGQFQVTINRVRNITVNVFGEAKTTGAFTLPAVNTAFNVLSAAGGPTDIGSVRKIKVISGSKVRILDVYEFMSDPGIAKNFFLQNNDYIHVPVADKVVEISGAITRPMAYELLEKENLSQLIKYAGGAQPNSYLSNIKIIRYLDDKQVITSVNYKDLAAGGGDYILYNGDKVEIKTIEDNALNFVNVSGAVYFEGKYEKKPGMRVSDLLVQSKPRPEARLDFAYLLQFQPDSTYRYERINLQSAMDHPATDLDPVLNEGDQLHILTQKSYVDKSAFSVTGAVRNPDTFTFKTYGNLKLEDAILLAGGLLIDADDHGYILRFNPSEPKTTEYLQINVRDAFDHPESASNVEIKAGDQIRIFSKAEMRDTFTVSIFGAVRRPGDYHYGPDMKLADLVNLAGGLTFGADRERIDIARSEFGNGKPLKITQYTASLPADFNLNMPSVNSIELKPFDHVYVRNIPEFEFQQTVEISGEVKYPGTYPILHDKERISDLIERAGGLSGEAFPEGAKMYRNGDSTGLVVINLNQILENENIPSNVILLSGDVINIPKSRDLVTIGGLVNLDEAYSEGFLSGERRISVAFRGEKNAKYYIDHFAAGVSKEGSPAEIKVQFADGGVEKTKKFLFFNKYPTVKRGSLITVGPKEVKQVVEKEKKEVDWGSVLKDTLTQATAVLTILILVDQLAK